MRQCYWTLEGKTPKPAGNLVEWARWFDDPSSNRTVGNWQGKRGSSVSTVFLGLDHNFGGDGPPLLFETMVFGGLFDDEQKRYATYEEAEKGHLLMVELARQAEEDEG